MIWTHSRQASSTATVAWSLCLLCLVAGPSLATAGTAPTNSTISAVHVTNVTDRAFTVSWFTDIAAAGHVNYGTTPALGSSQADEAGAGPYTHHVTLSGLTPEATYYFDVVADGQVDDNGGAHYQVTLPPTGGTPPSPDWAYGTVYQADGATPAAGVIAYVTLVDRNSSGSPGPSAPLSTLTSAAGVWFVNLGAARTMDYSTFFDYTASGGDLVHVQAQAGPDGFASLSADLGASYEVGGARNPLPDLLLGLPADVDGDSDEDVADIQRVAVAWGSTRTDSRYALRLDLDADGDVDAQDVAIAAERWGAAS